MPPVRFWALVTFLSLAVVSAQARKLDLKPHLQNNSQVENALIEENQHPHVLNICQLETGRYQLYTADDVALCLREGGNLDHLKPSDTSSMKHLMIQPESELKPWMRGDM